MKREVDEETVARSELIEVDDVVQANMPESS